MATQPLPPVTTARDTEVDILVIGSGTGMAAALSAHDSGLKALIIEKTQFVGGSTALSGGAFWIPGNHILKSLGGDADMGRAHTYLENVVGDSAPRARWEAFLEHGPSSVELLSRKTPLEFDWCKDYSDYHSELPGAAPSSRSCESKPFNASVLGSERARLRSSAFGAPIPMPVMGKEYKWMNLMVKVPHKGLTKSALRAAQGIGGLALKKEMIAGGQAIGAGLFAGVLEAGIPVWTETTVTTIDRDDNGRVTGVTVNQNGHTARVTARKGVILSAGGFDHNKAMRQEFQHESVTGDYSFGSPENTGDLITMAQQLGADTDLMDQVWWFPAIAPAAPGGAPTVMLAERSLPGSFIVGANGKRFINEAVDYMTYGQFMLEHERSGNSVGDTWIIFDQEYRNSYLFGAVAYPRSPLPKSWYDAGIAFKAENPTALARLIGVPEADFVAEMARFNAMARGGRDDDFNRGSAAYDRYYGDPTVTPNPNMRPLAGDLYAVKLVTGDLGTCGGLKADEYARVLDTSGAPIEGLYAVGNTAANAFGNRYPGAGATIGQGIVFSHIAVQHAKTN